MNALSFLFNVSLPVVWLILMVIFAIVEALTVGLASIWFAVGALAALLVSLACGNFWIQCVVFVAVSLVTLLLVRPLTAKHFRPRDHIPTNVDSLIGCSGVVAEAIDNLAGTGQVRLGGQFWTARSDSGVPIPQGSTVIAVRIEGVRLFVRPKKSENEVK